MTMVNLPQKKVALLRRSLPGAGALCLTVLLLAGSVHAQPAPAPDRVQKKVTFSVEPFALRDVRLLDGPFKDNQDRNARYLLSIEPDRLLHNFLKNAGLEPKAPLYGGWESQQIAGHSMGHFLSALAMQYAATGDERFKQRLDYTVSELARAQQALGTGYVSAIPDAPNLWQEVSAGTIKGEPFALNGVWVPWYTMHKIFAGLIDAYRHTGNAQALDVVTRLADWAYNTTYHLTPAQWQEMLKAEHGGMNEALADLYALTGNSKYMDLSRRFHHNAVLSPLAEERHDLEGKHANTQIPKVIGLARQYELLAQDSLHTASRYFWQQIVEGHTYAMGGNSEAEHLGKPRVLATRLKPSTAETCNTYNMLKLTNHLFELSADVNYAEFYERALFNHILASQDPVNGMPIYFLSLTPGHFKTYSTPDSSFWCCTGSGMENHTKYGEAIYFHNGDELIVNQFIASRLEWRDKGMQITQQTRFPNEPATTFRFEGKPGPVSLKIRHPQWARGPLQVRVNGKVQSVQSTPGSYLTLERTFAPGDSVTVTLPMSIHTESMPDDPNRVAILYGPLVLAGALGNEGMPANGAYAKDQWVFFEWPRTVQVPVLKATPTSLVQSVKPLAGSGTAFHTVGIGLPADVSLIPLYQMHHQRYSVYWDLVPPTP